MRANQLAIQIWRAYVKWKEILLMLAQQFGELQREHFEWCDECREWRRAQEASIEEIEKQEGMMSGELVRTTILDPKSKIGAAVANGSDDSVAVRTVQRKVAGQARCATPMGNGRRLQIA